MPARKHREPDDDDKRERGEHEDRR